jgi:phosphate starvation-inducible protein PhoH
MKNDNNYLKYNLEDIDLSEFENIENAEIEDRSIKIEDKRRRQKKLLRRMYDLKFIEPITENQKLAFEHWSNDKNLLLFGAAGSGKTFLAIYFALKELKAGTVNKIYIVRSAVTTRDQGFLPGSLAEKMALYEMPYRDIFKHMTLRADTYDILKTKGYYEFMSTSYIRGLNIDDAIIILDEAQNCTFHEIDSLLTRVGKNTRLILCGDTAQNDLQMHKKMETGINELISIVHDMEEFGCVKFTIDDIVRSGFVKKYLLAKMRLGVL